MGGRVGDSGAMGRAKADGGADKAIPWSRDWTGQARLGLPLTRLLLSWDGRCASRDEEPTAREMWPPEARHCLGVEQHVVWQWLHFETSSV